MQLIHLLKAAGIACIVNLALPSAQVMAAGSVTSAAGLKIESLPFELLPSSIEGKIKIENNNVIISANKDTDLFNDVFSGDKKDNAPRVLFEPKGDFIFSAKISGNFANKYDGGALIVYNDSLSWAKLLFERSHDGSLSIWTTITKKDTDDVQHKSFSESSVFLKILRVKHVYIFYSSTDGKNWSVLRSFTMDKNDTIKLGFLAQSSVGNEFTARFSDITFASKSLSNFWQGE